VKAEIFGKLIVFWTNYCSWKLCLRCCFLQWTTQLREKSWAIVEEKISAKQRQIAGIPVEDSL
jgi:hypothetical protein